MNLFKLFTLITCLFANIQVLYSQPEITNSDSTEFDAQHYFMKGREAFNNKDYNNAIYNFNKAHQLGYEKSVLFFNLGSSFYSLQQYYNATHYFQLVTKDPALAPLARYNLGLIAMKQNRLQDADRWFRKSYSSSHNQDMKRLSVKAVKRIYSSQRKQNKQRKKSSFKLLTSFKIGTDDNIAQIAHDATNQTLCSSQTCGDSFSSVSANLSGYAIGNQQQGIKLSSRINEVIYSDISDYDYRQSQFAAAFNYKINRWLWQAKGHYDAFKLDNKDYQDVLSISLLTQASLPKRSWLRFRIMESHYNSTPAVYKYLDGSRNELLMELGKYIGKNAFSLGAIFDYNDRNDEMANDTVYTSPSSQTIYMSLSTPFSSTLKAVWSAYAQNKKYQLQNNAANKRQDEKYNLIAKLLYKYNKIVTLNASLGYGDNQSNDDSYSYSHGFTSLGMDIQIF